MAHPSPTADSSIYSPNNDSYNTWGFLMVQGFLHPSQQVTQVVASYLGLSWNFLPYPPPTCGAFTGQPNFDKVKPPPKTVNSKLFNQTSAFKQEFFSKGEHGVKISWVFLERGKKQPTRLPGRDSVKSPCAKP